MMRKIITKMKNILTIFTLTLALATMPLFAQNIRQAKQAKAKQQQVDAAEKANVRKARITLSEFQQFADIASDLSHPGDRLVLLL